MHGGPSVSQATRKRRAATPRRLPSVHALNREVRMSEGLIEGFERKTVRRDGIDVDVLVGGSGRPLLLLRGWPQTRMCRAAVAPALADMFTLVITGPAWLRPFGQAERRRRPSGDFCLITGQPLEERHARPVRCSVAIALTRSSATSPFGRLPRGDEPIPRAVAERRQPHNGTRATPSAWPNYPDQTRWVSWVAQPGRGS